MPEGTRQIEMSWRCSSCQHRNLGRHTVCQQCGNAKDASEHYEMPGDTAAAPTITDPDVLQLAVAGANWRCAYCGGDQRRLDNACAQCGAAQAQDRPARHETRPDRPNRRWLRIKRWMRDHPILTGLGALVVFLLLAYAWSHRTRTYEAQVLAVRWQQNIVVERYQIWQRTGWAGEGGPSAFDIQSMGRAIHHYESVLDGYDSERYTEQVACGEDCSDTPEVCSERCSDNGNGFATCRTTCSGGGRSCTTRYCSEWRTREVPRYRSEPRYAERVRYRIWDWGDHRTAAAAGTSTTGLYWAQDDVRLGADLGSGEQERERREAYYRATLGYDDTERIEVEVGAERFAGLGVGTTHRLVIAGDELSVDGVPVRVIPAE